MNSLQVKFGKQLRKTRRAKGFTQEELAEATGLSVDFISLVERGLNAPSFNSIEKLADKLGVEVFNLFVFENHDSEKKHNR